MRLNDIVSVAKRELLVITNYKFSFLFIYLVSFYVGTYLSMAYTNLIPDPQIRMDTYLAYFFLSTEIVFSWALSTIQVLDYMRQRCMETILATPLSLTSILLCKSLAIFILSYIPSLLCVIIVFCQANLSLGLANLVFPSSVGWILRGFLKSRFWRKNCHHEPLVIFQRRGDLDFGLEIATARHTKCAFGGKSGIAMTPGRL